MKPSLIAFLSLLISAAAQAQSPAIETLSAGSAAAFFALDTANATRVPVEEKKLSAVPAPEEQLQLASDDERPAPSVNCEEDPGLGLCRRMLRISESLSLNCTGEACYSLWAEQMRNMNSFSRYFEDALPWRFQGTEEMGRLAYRNAHSICGTTMTGDPSTLTRIALSMNRALSGLRTVQRNSGRSNVAFCNIEVN